ncbi:unnamed protein product [Amoebophrya sp. A120]|nr:unnamed protein product [Amoebophrya sp. A120]|eukprot:GSA120T00017474001.1
MQKIREGVSEIVEGLKKDLLPQPRPLQTISGVDGRWGSSGDEENNSATDWGSGSPEKNSLPDLPLGRPDHPGRYAVAAPHNSQPTAFAPPRGGTTASSAGRSSSWRAASTGEQPEPNVAPAVMADGYDRHTALLIYSSSLQAWFPGFVYDRTPDVLCIRFVLPATGELKEKKLSPHSSCIRKAIDPPLSSAGSLEQYATRVESLVPPGFTMVESRSTRGKPSYLQTATGVRFASLNLAWEHHFRETLLGEQDSAGGGATAAGHITTNTATPISTTGPPHPLVTVPSFAAPSGLSANAIAQLPSFAPGGTGAALTAANHSPAQQPPGRGLMIEQQSSSTRPPVPGPLGEQLQLQFTQPSITTRPAGFSCGTEGATLNPGGPTRPNAASTLGGPAQLQQDDLPAFSLGVDNQAAYLAACAAPAVEQAQATTPTDNKTYQETTIPDAEREMASQRLLQKSLARVDVKKRSPGERAATNPFEGWNPSPAADQYPHPLATMQAAPALQSAGPTTSSQPHAPPGAALLPLHRPGPSLPSFSGPGASSTPERDLYPNALASQKFAGVANEAVVPRDVTLPDFSRASMLRRMQDGSVASHTASKMDAFGAPALSEHSSIPCAYTPDVPFGAHPGPERLVALPPR